MNVSSGVNRSNKNKSKRSKMEKVKVVYISSPMKVKTSASRFRSLVQELTGCNSDVARFMDLNGVAAFDSQTVLDDQEISESIDGGHDHRIPMLRVNHDQVMESHNESSTSSESLLEPFDQVFTSHQMDQRFSGLFTSSLFYEPSLHLDVLGSYDAL